MCFGPSTYTIHRIRYHYDEVIYFMNTPLKFMLSVFGIDLNLLAITVWPKCQASYSGKSVL